MKMLDAFKKQVKKCGEIKRAWFTTFNLDIEFFEKYVLPALLGEDTPRVRMDYEELQLKAEKAGIDIRIFCDRGFMGMGRNKRTATPVYGLNPGTWRMRRDYGFHEESLFHPKVIYLEGENGQVLGAGSANLTLSGWGRNQESYHFIPVDHLDTYREVREFFESVFEMIQEEESPLALFKRGLRKGRRKYRFCHSFQEESFLDQLFDQEKCEELAVWSPYFPRDLDGFVSTVGERCSQPEIRVMIVPDRLEDGRIRTLWSDALAKSIEAGRVSFHRPPLASDERVSMRHAKVWKTPSYLAVGSWNFTAPGASSTVGKDGRFTGVNNVEAGFILKDRQPLSEWVGKKLAIDAASCADESLLEEEALIVPEAPPFDVHVVFDWARLEYAVSATWNSDRDKGQYFLRLPGLERPLAITWGEGRDWKSQVTVRNAGALLADHHFDVLTGDELVFTGVVVERGLAHRRVQRFVDLRDLVDAALLGGDAEELTTCAYRVSEDGGEPRIDDDELDGVGQYAELGKDESLNISYFRLFSAFDRMAAQMRDAKNIEALEYLTFKKPGGLEELVDKTRSQVEKTESSVFNWFLCQEVNRLSRFALKIRAGMPKRGRAAVPPIRWESLIVEIPPLPSGASKEYAHLLAQEEYAA